MKVALITYSRARNYGGILQAYALFYYLASIGYDVEFIDYILPTANIYDKKLFVDTATKRSRIWGRNDFTRWLWGQFIFPKIKKDYQVFSEFIERNAKFGRRYFSYEELSSDPPEADVYVSGSDQIWNEHFTGTGVPDLSFFLGFAPKGAKRISYASSFGKSEISTLSQTLIAPLLKQYAHVSVREVSGKEMLEKIGVNAAITLDPTMLCDTGIWRDLCNERLIQNDYIFLYLIRFDQRLYEIAQRLAETCGKQIVAVTLSRQDAIKKYGGKAIVAAKVEDWLSYIRYAEIVLTDSFHAMVFSLLFQKDFVVNTATRENMSGRITGLLSKLGIEELEMHDFDTNTAQSIATTRKDWKDIMMRIERERADSQQWLKDALKG